MLGILFALISALVSGSITVKLLIVISLILLWKSTKRPSDIPPGPLGLPILGYLPFLTRPKLQLLRENLKKYGPVFSFYLGDQLTVILQDYNSIHKALSEQGEVFSGRPDDMPAKLFPVDAKALLSTEGHLWREHRRFALSAFKDFGAGKSSMEPRLLDEISYFLDAVNKHKGEPFDITDDLGRSVCNNTVTILYGSRFDYSDPEFQKTVQWITATANSLNKTALNTKFPWLRNITVLEWFHMYQGMKTWFEFSIKQNDRIITEHRKNFFPGKYDDYIDAYLNEVQRREKAKNEPEIFDDITLNANLRIILGAGTETTTTFIRWSLVFLMSHPDIQSKVQAEIDEVIGRERSPTSEDRLNMPYTEATMQEVHRRGSVLWLNLPHRNTEETKLLSFRIPKHSTVMTNLHAVHHDEKLFPDPFSFRPERFINEKGQFVKSEHVIPFGTGKRACLGESLGRMEIFLYLTSMLQKFTFRKPDGEVLPTESEPDFANAPLPYKLIAVPRT